MCIRDRFNRWIRATNAVIRDIKKKIALLFDWIVEAKAELAKPQAPDLVSLLNAYYTPVSYTHLCAVTGRAKRRDRATKSQKPNGMGAADERLQGTGRGDCESGIDL